MICRREGDGWLLITQPAHAWLAGALAAAWGNREFVAPTPAEAVVLATRLHDIGWQALDAAPRLGDTGLPVNFLDSTLEETIPIWRQGVQHVALLDPYAALLVSMHASTLYQRRLSRKADPPQDRSEAQAMLDEQQTIQEVLASRLADHPTYAPFLESERRYAAYRWLRACDLFSLVLCSDAFPPSGEIDAVPGGDWNVFTKIRYVVREPFTVVVDPWPFKEPAIHLLLQARYLNRASYSSQAAYLASLGQAPWVPRTVTLLAP